jgi:uncharacterized protein YbjT (DUF2867 family)
VYSTFVLLAIIQKRPLSIFPFLSKNYKKRMKNILVFGATGHTGSAFIQELIKREYQVTAVVRDKTKAQKLLPSVQAMIQADALQHDTLRGICTGFDVVISALGKSVSPFSFDKPSFEAVDLRANLNILAEAKAANVRQFIYVSAFGAENAKHLTYFRVHDAVSNAVKNSGLNYTILQPPAIMSSFLDIADLAKKGWSMTVGKGDCRTNPISEQDLAKVCADQIGKPSAMIAAGGKHIYTRHEINQVIQKIVNPHKKVGHVPSWVVRSALFFWKVMNRNLYDKLAFFYEVMHHEVLAPPVGEMTLESYFQKNTE